MSAGIEWHANVSGPKRFVQSRKVDTHLIEMFNGVVSWFESKISHLAQPKVHSLSSPVSIFMEEVAVASE